MVTANDAVVEANIPTEPLETQTTTPLPAPKRLGRINEQHIEKDIVTYINQYVFSMATGSLHIVLENVGNHAKLSLIRRTGRNGVSNSGDIIVQSQLGNNNDQILSIDGLGGGTFLLQVDQVGQGHTAYVLKVNVRPGVFEYENEKNDSFHNANMLDDDGRINLNGYRMVRGALDGRQDRTDIYRFQVRTTSSFTARVNNFNSGLQLTLLSLSGEVLTRSHPTPRLQVLQSERLSAGTYYIQVRKMGSGTTTYNLSLSANPVTQAQLAVAIRRIKAIDDFEGFGRGEADFYAKMSIDGATYKSDAIDNKDDVRPNFRFSRNVGIRKVQIPMTISIYESDGRSSGDEHADINPKRGVKDLKLMFYPITGKVTSPDLPIYQEGSWITVQGRGDSHRALVTFQVDYYSYR